MCLVPDPGRQAKTDYQVFRSVNDMLGRFLDGQDITSSMSLDVLPRRVVGRM